MTDPKKKKKYGEPQYLFAWNKNFASGQLDTPGNKEQIAAAIAERYHISPYINIFAEKQNSGLGCVIGIAVVFIPIVLLCLLGIAFLLGALGYYVFVDENIKFSGLFSFIIGLLAISSFLVIVFLWLRTELNYRPKKLSSLYKKLIEDGKIAEGQYMGKGFSYAHRHNLSYKTIKYQFEDETGKVIQGEISYQFLGTTEHLVEGMPIQVVYVDDKLHAPL